MAIKINADKTHFQELRSLFYFTLSLWEEKYYIVSILKNIFDIFTIIEIDVYIINRNNMSKYVYIQYTMKIDPFKNHSQISKIYLVL